MKNSRNFRQRSSPSRVPKRAALALGLLAALVVTAFFATPKTDRRTRTAVRHGRLPSAALWTSSQSTELKTALARALRPGVARVRRVSAVVLAQNGRVLYSQSAREALTPASSLKVLIAITALQDLGPDYRLHTFFSAADLPDAAGRLAVPLWLIGTGDPSLRYNDLRGGVRVVYAGGVRSIPRVIVDAHAISGPEINPLWNQSDANEDYQVATSGMSLDEDTVEFHVEGTSPGKHARIYVEPPSDAVRWSGAVLTTKAGARVDVEPVAPNSFAVSGLLGAGGKRTEYLPIHNVPRYAGAVAERMLKERGVVVGRASQVGIAPAHLHVFWDHRSPTLRAMVKHMLVHSDNHFAEQLLRLVGRVTSGMADDRAGIAAERRLLGSARIPTDGLRLYDASGLAHADRVSAWSLALLLAYAQRAGDQLYPLLPRGGVDGTLRRYRFQAARARVRAKSGHLDDVDALAGYIDTRRHGRLTFAFLVEGTRYVDDDVAAALDRLATL